VSHVEHKAQAPAAARVAVITVSDTRSEATDTSGAAIRALLVEHGHRIVGSAIVPDDPEKVTAAVERHLSSPEAQVIVTTGGTGITSRDGTYEAVVRLLDKRLDGFGELFRVLSYEAIGSPAMMSRATAGTARGKAIFVLPGSENAVRLAMTKLILPELGHVLQQLAK
jgi:molybdenum cofactor biosynthesis protein B